MAGQPTPRKAPPSPNGAPTLTPLGHYAGRPDIAISRQVTVVGSKTGSRLHLASSTVSKNHALIVNSSAGPYVRDLCSRTKVLVNGKASREADLADGDLLQIGKFKFQFNAGVDGAGLAPGRSAPVGGFDPAPGAVLNVEGGEMPVPFEGRSMLVGRRPICDIPLVEDSVSTAHAVIFEMNGKRFIRDLGSRTGTYVNGRRVEQAPLNFGDEIKIGETAIVYSSASSAAEVEVDEMDHLVSTAPLGTAALDLADLTGGDGEARDASAAPVRAGESEYGKAAGIAPSPAVPAVPARPPRDQVHLDSDPDVGGAPGDTAVLPAAEAAPAARKTPPMLKPPGVDGDDVIEATPRAAERSKDIDDALGLTVEARRREEATAEDLGGSRRGWRGMSGDELSLPLADHTPIGAPPPAPQPEDDASSDDAPPDDAPPDDAFAEGQVAEEQVARTGPEDEVIEEDRTDQKSVAEDAAAEKSIEEGAAAEDLTAEDASADDALAEDALAEDIAGDVIAPPVIAPLDATEDEDELGAEREAADIEGFAVDDVARDEIPLIDDEPAPAAEAPAEADDDEFIDVTAAAADEAEPAPLHVGQEIESPAALPPEAFKVEPEDEGVPLATQSQDAAELHLPPVIDDAITSDDAAANDDLDLSGLQLTPDDAPLDLSVKDTEQVAEEPLPELDLGPPEPERTWPLAAGAIDEPPREPGSRDAAKVRVQADADADAEMETAPATPSAAAPMPELDLDAFAPPLEDFHEAPRDTVEVIDQTQPTPESALDIEDAVADMLAEPLAVDDASDGSDVPAAAELTDTRFGRDIEAFSAESTGPLVEARRESEPAGEPRARDVEPLAAEPETIEAAASPAEAEAIDDLIADVMTGDKDGELDHAQRLAEAEEDAAVAELDRAIEEAVGGAAPVAGDAQPSEEREQATEQPVAAAEGAAEEKGAETAEPVAAAPAPAPPAATPPPPSPGNWGANQEHFLGGMPLKLNQPAEAPSPVGRVGVSFDRPAPLHKPAEPAPAAAAAGAPSAPHAPPPQQSPLFMPPPPRATRGDARTRSPFDISPFDISPAGAPVNDAGGTTIPPFVGNAPKMGQITTGFDGLAMPPVRQTDVFSQMATPAAFVNGLAGIGGGGGDDINDIFSRGAKRGPERRPEQRPPGDGKDGGSAKASATDDEPPSPADAVWADGHRDHESEQPVAAGDASRDSHDASMPHEFPAGDEEATAAAAAAAPAKRRRRWFGLRLLLVLMLLSGGAAAAGIYTLVGKRTNVAGMLRFANFESLKTIEQQHVLTAQRALLADQALREAARTVLAQRHPDLTPGFLADPAAYQAAAAQAAWSAERKGALVFPYSGRDERGDPARVGAVMLALYEANKKAGGDSTAPHGTIDRLAADHARSQQRVTDLKAQIERLSVVAQQMPERKRMEQLNGEVAALDRAYNDAVRKVKEVSADVERMRQGLPDNPQPAGTAQAPVVDPELSKMQEELTATQRKLTETKAARAKAAEQARVALDAALDQFQKQIVVAQDAARDNPQLSAYVAAAEKLQTSTRELTDQLISRQQEQQKRLAELKTSLGEKMEARRADAWKKDPKLQELSNDLAIVQRQYGAAVGGGAKKEAEEYKAQVSLLEEMIKARQTLVGDDAFYADAINQLQKLIDDQQRGLDADRKRTEGVLEEMQVAFANSQPAAAKMPQAQQELAESLEKRLAAINAARRQYTQASDAAAAGSGDEGLKKMEAAAAALAAGIAERRKVLTADAAKAATAQQEQQRVKDLKTREAELAAAQTEENTARDAWAAAQKKLREAQASEAEAREAGEKRDALQTERVAAQKELEATLRQLELARAQASRSVEPIPPTQADVQMSVSDPRPVYAFASVSGIVAAFTLLILLTSSGAAADPQVPLAERAQTDEDYPPPAPQADAVRSARADLHQDDPDETPSRLAV